MSVAGSAATSVSRTDASAADLTVFQALGSRSLDRARADDIVALAESSISDSASTRRTLDEIRSAVSGDTDPLLVRLLDVMERSAVAHERHARAIRVCWSESGVWRVRCDQTGGGPSVAVVVRDWLGPGSPLVSRLALPRPLY